MPHADLVDDSDGDENRGLRHHRRNMTRTSNEFRPGPELWKKQGDAARVGLIQVRSSAKGFHHDSVRHERCFHMRRAVAAIFAFFVPYHAMAQVAPAGWATIVGKTCDIRVAARILKANVDATFMQDASGPSVQLRAATTLTFKVRFMPPNGIGFDSPLTADGYAFSYDDKAKTWSGVFAGEPAYLECPP
jgi:hypothetical protein